MKKPVRVQCSRKHKSVSPNELPVVYVGRPTKWGNPLKLMGDMIYIDAGHRRKILDKWVLYIKYVGKDETAGWKYGLEYIVGMYERFFEPVTFQFNDSDSEYWHNKFQELKKDLHELHGKNLACWCPLDKPCHADILLKLANSE